MVGGVPPGNVLQVIPRHGDDVRQFLVPPVGVHERSIQLGLARVAVEPSVRVEVKNLMKTFCI